MIKKTLVTAVLLLVAANVWAVPGPQDVSGTRHNLSSTSVNIPGGNMYMAGNEDEVCIFCHTPHGGSLNGPLWNRTVPDVSGANAFTHYANASLSTAELRDAARPISPESLLCMSCHDGSVATGNMNNILNASNDTGAAPNNAISIQPMFFTVGSVIGDAPDPSGFGTLGQTRNLTDDHPISFSYHDVSVLPANSSKLRTVAQAEGSDIRFFPLNGADVAGGKRMECSSCHNPHVNYEAANGGNPAYTPFLVTPNTGSALCLACHIK